MKKIEYLDKIENFLFTGYNYYAYIRFCFFKNKNVLKKNNDLKKISKNFCFIIGNGPSLKETELKKIKSFPIFTVNEFYKGKISKDIESDYHVLIDEAYFNEKIDYLSELYSNCPNTKFLYSIKGYKTISNKLKKLDNTYFIYSKFIQNGKKIHLNLTQNTTACLNVVLECIQCAMFMGYKNIFLLGCDFNSYAVVKPVHFYSDEVKESNVNRDGVNIGSDLRYSSLVHYHHYALSEYANRNGISIINLTKNSLIDAYPKKELDEILINLGENNANK